MKHYWIAPALLALLALFVMTGCGGGSSSQTATKAADGTQEVKVIVKGAYQPDTVFAEEGAPLRILFQRDESVSCSNKVVFPDLNIEKDLLAHKTTPVEIPAQKAGEYRFTCGMNMLQGKLVVKGKAK